MFVNCMLNYEDVLPYRWDSKNLTTICLEIIPKKLIAEVSFFEGFGDVLIAFLKFLHSKDYIKNSVVLIKTVEKIKDKIPTVANNSENWGMSKAFIMSARANGVDINDKETMDTF